ncbi:MAG: substrate-binding domain-containing protein [Bacteroidota bacterium]|jgi:phosphate transport system substrate-binding protein|nr:substrate-binding domain-containing protein [Bacteroidota bacterium]
MKGPVLLLALSCILFFACSDDEAHKRVNKITISVDETYQPVFEQLIKVFTSSYPLDTLIVHYKSEQACLDDLLHHKSNLVFVTRQLEDQERAYFKQKELRISSLHVAKDGIAMIINKQSPDSFLNKDQIRSILTNKYVRPYTIVFDNAGSSTVRYIQDSILKNEAMSPQVYAAKSNAAVLDYVANNPKAIGFVGLDYVQDTSGMQDNCFTKRVQVVSIYNDSTKEFYQPYQAYIALKVYPLVRKLYFINSEQKVGAGTDFINFVCKERGQLIFAHAHMFPLHMEIIIRETNLNTH